MKTISAMFITMLFTAEISAQDKGTQPVFDSYLKLKDALVKSDAVNAAAFSNELATAISSIQAGNLKPEEKKVFSNEKENLLTNARSISKTTDLEKQRTIFAELSVTLWKLVKVTDNIEGNLYYQYCPMKKMYWLSAEAAIKNPYYGSAMLTCGSVTDKKLKL